MDLVFLHFCLQNSVVSQTACPQFIWQLILSGENSTRRLFTLHGHLVLMSKSQIEFKRNRTNVKNHVMTVKIGLIIYVLTNMYIMA